MQPLLVLLLLAAASAHPLQKRDNSYGDEPVAPAAPADNWGGDGGDFGGQDAGGAAPEEHAPVEESSFNDAPAPEVEQSGYRMKRDNSYGDEPVAPEAPAENWGGDGGDAGGQDAGGAAPEEYAPVEESSFNDAPAPEVEQSGYRMKRDNSYGDEPVAPETPAENWGGDGGDAGGQDFGGAAPEEYAPVEESSFNDAPAPEVEQSGYRMKRDNSYGDEPVAPEAPAENWGGDGGDAGGQDAGGAAPEEYAPVEESSFNDAPAPEVEQSGYRMKRDNSYGDEPVAPEAPAENWGGDGGDSGGQDFGGAAPEEYAPVEESSFNDAPAPEVEQSGYRL